MKNRQHLVIPRPISVILLGCVWVKWVLCSNFDYETKPLEHVLNKGEKGMDLMSIVRKVDILGHHNLSTCMASFYLFQHCWEEGRYSTLENLG